MILSPQYKHIETPLEAMLFAGNWIKPDLFKGLLNIERGCSSHEYMRDGFAHPTLQLPIQGFPRIA